MRFLAKPYLLLSLLPLLSMAQVQDLYSFRSDIERNRYYALIDELRCPKCQNQNLADSNAELANDLREKIVELIQKGYNDEEVVAFMVERYGEFVRYEPVMSRETYWLWFGPLLLAVSGIGILLMSTRRREEETSKAELSEKDQLRLKELVKENESD